MPFHLVLTIEAAQVSHAHRKANQYHWRRHADKKGRTGRRCHARLNEASCFVKIPLLILRAAFRAHILSMAWLHSHLKIVIEWSAPRDCNAATIVRVRRLDRASSLSSHQMSASVSKKSSVRLCIQLVWQTVHDGCYSIAHRRVQLPSLCGRIRATGPCNQRRWL